MPPIRGAPHPHAGHRGASRLPVWTRTGPQTQEHHAPAKLSRSRKLVSGALAGLCLDSWPPRQMRDLLPSSAVHQNQEHGPWGSQGLGSWKA